MGKASSLSTKKRLRQSKKAQARNRSNKTRLKSQLKKIRSLATSGSAVASKSLSETYSVIDKAVKKGVLHKNAAARHKARLSRLVNSEK
ncbi:MAG TPA: 30S ribosomal protein S20 [Acidobacteriota bacterium]|jgi:small subunit ribosomal protein S20|nr:30S ribosomal protein S20 [Acidobacteriota bacterium]